MTTLRKPLPEKEPVGAGDPGLVVVGLGAVPPPDFGRYFMPVEGQSEFEPTAHKVLAEGLNHGAYTKGRVVRTWIGWNKCSCLHTALCIVKIPDLIQITATALYVDADSTWCFQGRQDVRGSVGLGAAWSDSGIGKELSKSARL